METENGMKRPAGGMHACFGGGEGTPTTSQIKKVPLDIKENLY